MTKAYNQITLRHLYINQKRHIGLEFKTHKVLNAMIKELPHIQWNEEFSMYTIPNKDRALDKIFNTFRGVAWVNTKYFFKDRPIKMGVNEPLKIKRTVVKTEDWIPCPEEYIQKLELKRYALNTAKTYISFFERYVNHFAPRKPQELNENDIRSFLEEMIKSKASDSSMNQAVNAIKFYYEIVLGMPNRFYHIERPRKKKPLPKVISKKEAKSMIDLTQNLKHKCILSLLYASGLRRSEVLNLRLEHIESDRMLIYIRDAKSGKDRYTLLGQNQLNNLRLYYREYKPKTFLFEGRIGESYSATSIMRIVEGAARRAGVTKRVTPHMLRHSFSTHLLESGVDLRYIQSLLGHNSSRTTEIYTHVAVKQLSTIKNLLD